MMIKSKICQVEYKVGKNYDVEYLICASIMHMERRIQFITFILTGIYSDSFMLIQYHWNTIVGKQEFRHKSIRQKESVGTEDNLDDKDKGDT